MPRLAAFIRALNVGGTGNLPMSTLKSLCEGLGFTEVATYIQSGNVVFWSDLHPSAIEEALEDCLRVHMGKTHEVFVRSQSEISDILAKNPYGHRGLNRVLVTLLKSAPPPVDLGELKGRQAEEITVCSREVYVHYPESLANPKLVLKPFGVGTARNINTLHKVFQLLTP